MFRGHEAVPLPVLRICQRIAAEGHQAYIVGGAVRDTLLHRAPKDWDIATDLIPEKVMELFPRNIPTGLRFGTVTVLEDEMSIEVTTFRADGDYSDGRRPDKVMFSSNIEEDLARRDFTINAIAYDPLTRKFVDPFNGQRHLKDQVICTVGNAEDRFLEDALRMLRAVRFFVTLPGKWRLDKDTQAALSARARTLRFVSNERIRDEFNKILLSGRSRRGLYLLLNTGLLKQFFPEIVTCADVKQNKFHCYDVFGHIVSAVQNTPPELVIRLAALFHDVGKPRALSVDEQGERHFYGHQNLSAAVAINVMKRLRYPSDLIDQVEVLVRQHMFVYSAATSNDTVVRRLINRVGEDLIFYLIALRRADQLASADTVTTNTILLEERVREILSQKTPVQQSQLAVDGHAIMSELGLCPGPEVGQVKQYLMERVLEDPSLNTVEALTALMHEAYTSLT